MKMGPLGNVKIVMRLKEEDKKRRGESDEEGGVG